MNKLFYLLLNKKGEQDQWDYSFPLTFRAEQANSAIELKRQGSFDPNPQYRLGRIGTWLHYDFNDVITLSNIGDEIQFKTNTNTDRDVDNFIYFSMSGTISAYGNVMSMINNDSIEQHAFYKLFQNCSSLIKAPTLPATTLANYCYQSMFIGCSNLVKVQPSLPATILANSCYQQMFDGCSSLKDIPQLPALNMNSYSYRRMFKDCISLTGAAELPALGLNTGCYQQMFDGCSSLIEPPEFLAISGGTSQSFYQMFIGCSSLTAGIDLDYITAIGNSSCRQMYKGCSSLIEAPKFQTVLSTSYASPSAFCGMFQDCISLTGAGEIPNLRTQGGYVYSNMYKGCINLENPPTLKYERIQFSSSPHYAMQSMFQGCSKLKDTINLSRFTYPNTTSGLLMNAYKDCSSLTGATIPTGSVAPIEGYFSAFQNCVSLQTAPNLPATTINQYSYFRMFFGCSNLKNVPSTLPATSVNYASYQQMFMNCTSLTSTPTLPATTIADYCYYQMFSGCSNLTTISNLPATTLYESCYRGMFSDCTKLVNLSTISATTLAPNCMRFMFGRSPALTQAPALPATTLADSCYMQMFYNCKGLITGPNCTFNNLTGANQCNQMFYGCDHLTTLSGMNVAAESFTGNHEMYEMCLNCSALTQAPILQTINLSDNCYQEMFSGCSSLQTLPNLPFTSVGTASCKYMFRNCSNLSGSLLLKPLTLTEECFRGAFANTKLTSVEILATTLANWCFLFTFQACPLTEMRVNFTQWGSNQSTTDYTWQWMDQVTTTGTFYKPAALPETARRNANGIPLSWTVVNI